MHGSQERLRNARTPIGPFHIDVMDEGETAWSLPVDDVADQRIRLRTMAGDNDRRISDDLFDARSHRRIIDIA